MKFFRLILFLIVSLLFGQAVAQGPFLTPSDLRRLGDNRYSQPLPVRIKNAANSPAALNYFKQQPIIAPNTTPWGSWAASTAYSAGQAIVVNGNVYWAMFSATSAATQPTFVPSYTARVTDNTEAWEYKGPLLSPNNQPDAPMITAWNSNPGTTIPSYLKLAWGTYTPVAQSLIGKVTHIGGYPLIDQTLALVNAASTLAVSAGTGGINGAFPGFSGSRGIYEFYTDAPQFALTSNYTASIFVYVDGVPLTTGNIAIGTGSGNAGSTFDFTSPQQTITTLTQSGNTITVGTSSAFTVVPWVNQQITISGCSNNTLNGTFTVASVTSGSSFTLTSPTSQTVASTPGTPGIATENAGCYGRRFRKITVCELGNQNVPNLYTGPYDTVRPVQESAAVRSVGIGDSYFGGAGIFPIQDGATCAGTVAGGLGWIDNTISGVGGTALINTNGGYGNFIQRASSDVLGNYPVCNSGTAKAVATMTQSGNTITVTLSTGLSYTPFNGQWLKISGSSQANFNGVFPVTNGYSAISFTVSSPISQTVASSPATLGTVTAVLTPVNAITGTSWKPYDVVFFPLSINDSAQTVSAESTAAAQFYYAIRNGFKYPISSISQTGNIITVNLTGSGYAGPSLISTTGLLQVPTVGQSFTFAGNANSAFNGTFTVSTVTSNTQFTLLTSNNTTIASDPTPGNLVIAGNPTCVICMIGMCIPPGNYVAQAASIEALEAGVFANMTTTAAGDSRFFMCPVSSLISPVSGFYDPLYWGSNYSNMGSGTAYTAGTYGNTYALWQDGVHPTQFGADSYGYYVGQWFRNVVIPALN